MNTKQAARIALVIVPLLMVLTGCYTQVETTREAQYYVEHDSSEADTSDGYSAEPNYYSNYGWYPNYQLGFSYYHPSYSWYPFFSSWYSPWYYSPYGSSFYGYYHYPYYYGHGFGSGSGFRRDTRKFGHTRSGSVRRMATSNNGYQYRSTASSPNRTSRTGSGMRRSASRNSFGNNPLSYTRQPSMRNRSASPSAPNVSPRSNARGYSRPPSYRPSRPSYSSPQSGGYRGGGGSRGGGSRGGHR